jgi:hypothetical protein
MAERASSTYQERKMAPASQIIGAAMIEPSIRKAIPPLCELGPGHQSLGPFIRLMIWQWRQWQD